MNHRDGGRVSDERLNRRIDIGPDMTGMKRIQISEQLSDERGGTGYAG